MTKIDDRLGLTENVLVSNNTHVQTILTLC